LFEGDFFLHPVMTGLGIMMVKINHPAAFFNGLLEFWPWDVIWDGAAASFRRVPAQPSPTSYGHMPLHVIPTSENTIAALHPKGSSPSCSVRQSPGAPSRAPRASPS